MSDAQDKQHKVFGNKDTNRLRSPEELQNYIQVTNPSVWIVLGAVIVFLLGVLGWCVFGRIPLNVSTVAVADGGTVTCYVKADAINEVAIGNPVSIGESTGTGEPVAKLSVASVAAQPVLVDTNVNQYVCNIGNLTSGEYVYEVTLQGACASGIYPAQITTGYLTPLTFIVN